jgi:ribosomal protein L11 methyltransferase
MRQIRLYHKAPRIQIEQAAKILEPICEDYGWPLALAENPDDVSVWTLSVYLSEDTLNEAQTRLESALLDAGHKIAFSIEAIAEIDWVLQSLSGLSPVYAGKFVIIGSHDIDKLRFFDRGIIINAGQAFGTGHHGTTAGCLEMLDENLKHRKFVNVLDLGTGSGVLAIAIAKTLPARILASDIDPVAIQVAQDNARLNHVHRRIEFVVSAGMQHRRFAECGSFDLIIANILAGPLQALSRDICRHLSRGARLILSGLLPHQKARIIAYYRMQGLALIRSHYRDGWLILVMEKP